MLRRCSLCHLLFADPCVVSVFGTFIYFIGVFTVLFFYAGKLDGACAAGPAEMLESLQSVGIFFIVWFTIGYVPMLLLFLILSLTHFRAHTDVAKSLQQLLLAMQKKEKEGAEKKGPRSEINGDGGTVAGLFNGHLIRQTYVLTLVLQFLMCVVVFSSRLFSRPVPEICVDADAACGSWARIGLCASRGGTGTDEAAEFCVCRYADNGLCEYPNHCHPGTDEIDCQSNETLPSWCDMNELRTQVHLRHNCCASCEGTPAEIGTGSIYIICVLGALLLGYDAGFLSSYLSRGKDVRPDAGTLIETRFKRRWHARHIAYPCVKCILMTCQYFVTSFSLFYKFRANEAFCPQDIIDVLVELSGKGLFLFITVTFLAVPLILAELLLCKVHFKLYQEYNERYFSDMTQTGLGAVADQYSKIVKLNRENRARKAKDGGDQGTVNPINQYNQSLAQNGQAQGAPVQVDEM